MKGHTIRILILAMGMLMASHGAFAASLLVQFDFEGMGNMITSSPPLYSGDIISGDDIVLGATWWIRLDDSNWPSASTPEARWTYLFNNFFTYSPTSYSWTGVFDEYSCGTKPEWEIEHSTNGMMHGTLVVVVTYVDENMNGVLDLDERDSGEFSGTLIVMKYGTGEFATYCGGGSYNGDFANSDPANWADD
ncbi:MAG: hypothetical protein PHD74_09775, partial [Candidatus Krumholzibacteria bacterium]|nr:hypothetical protein [Candidatus Krumholzibacteria bacterium]